MSATQDMDIDSREPATVPRHWVADPSKLDMTKPAKKRKYYGVRKGHQAGIYYRPEEADKQSGKGWQMAAFKTAAEVEEFMNHLPDDCRFEQCAASCRAAKEISRQRSDKSSKPPASAATSKLPARTASKPPASGASKPASSAAFKLPVSASPVCDCCGSSRPAVGAQVCRACLANPALYLEVIVQRYVLIPEQAEVLRGVAGGENAFITGSVGTGKSKLLKAMVEYFRGLGSGVAAVAPMGLAATAMGGQTLQMFMRSLVGWEADVDGLSLEHLTGQARQRSIALGRPVTDILILDDANTIDNHKFSRLSMAMAAAVEPLNQQKSQRPFGGAQVIVCADFFKLPPLESLLHCIWCGAVTEMSRDETARTCKSHGTFALDRQYAFCSAVWQQCRFIAVELTHSHRQYSADLARILSELRWTGGVSEENMRYLRQRASSMEGAQQGAVVLRPVVPSGSAALEHNMAGVESLPDDAVVYSAVDDLLWDAANHPEMGGHDTGRGGEGCWHFAFQDHELEHGLRLKLGMLVILVADLDPSARLLLGEPEKQAGPVTVPGSTLRGEYRHYQELQIKRFDKKQLDPARKWPVVEFANGTIRTIYATCLVREIEKSHQRPSSLLSRTQIPLTNGSNRSLHQVQNITFDKVLLQLRGCTEPGQAYVAFSRVRSLDDLVIESMPDKVMAPRIVQGFMSETFQGEPVQGPVREVSAEDDVEMVEL